MPSTTEKQKRFFGAVMGAKKGKPGASGKAKEVASEMSEEKIKHYLHKESSVEDVYAQGFMDACNAHGVDPKSLLES